MRDLDILIIGATGFTGKYTVKYLLKVMEKNGAKFSWGISARSKEKIRNLLLELEENGENMEIPVVECDIIKDDVRNVTCRAKIIINCTGPNIILCENIINACIKTRTHYVDISAELYPTVKMYKKFHKLAEESNVLIVPSCGFAVVPVATGLMYLENEFKGTLTSVECYMDLSVPKRAYVPGGHCLVNGGTWASMVYEWQNVQAYKRLKSETFSEQIYEPVPSEINRSYFHINNGKICFFYPGPDQDLVEMSQRYLHSKEGKKPYHFRMYASLPAWFLAFIIFPGMFLYYLLSYFKCFSNLLRKYPGYFSLGYMSYKGPSVEMASDTEFVMTFKAKGLDENSREKSAIVKVSGNDPGYKTTPLVLIYSALTILTESSGIPKGGVLNPGAAFKGTQILENLRMNEVLEYEFMEN